MTTRYRLSTLEDAAARAEALGDHDRAAALREEADETAAMLADDNSRDRWPTLGDRDLNAEFFGAARPRAGEDY